MPDLSAITELREAFTAKRKWKALEKGERKLEKAMESAFRKQGRAFMAAMDRKAGLQEAEGDVLPQDWEAIFDAVAADTAASFAEPIQLGIETSLIQGGTHAVSDFAVGSSFDLANPRAVDFLENRAELAVAGIDDATKEQLRTIISNGVADGKSYDAIAREIRERFNGFSAPSPLKHIRSRSHLVAVTEMGNAYEAGNRAVIDGLVDAGLTMEKRWSTVGDSRVDADCEGNESEDWIPVEDTFSSGDDTPLAHPGCRCGALYRRQPRSARAA